jgi:flagellar M-ring protein FliF
MADARPNPASQVVTQLKELWGKQSKKRKTLAIVVVLGIAGVIAFSQIANRSASWVVVSEGASIDDAQELFGLLSSRDLPVRMREGKIEVAGHRVAEARAIAASVGLPRSGKGFELFDGSSLGQSSFTEQVNYRRALQGELARSITALAQVQSARVHLALGKRSVFKDQEEAASASVALHLHAGQQLSAEQVRGVRQMVAGSVEGLKPDAVVVVDHHGNLLDATGNPTTSDRRADIERSLTQRTRAMLERVVGAGKVSVVVTADVDDRQLSEVHEIYDQTNPVLRSEARSIDGEGAIAGIGGIAGTRGNLPGAPVAQPTPGTGSGQQRVQETKNYEVNKTVRQVKKPEVQLQKLHVAILVDHKTGTDGKPVARTKDELAELTAVARNAAGIDDARGDKIEVRSIPFVVDPEVAPVAAAPAGEQLPLVPIAIGAGALLLAIVMFVMMRSKKKANKLDAPVSLALPLQLADLERALEASPALAEKQLTAPSTDQSRALPPGRPVRDRVLEVVRNDAERAAEVLTAWLSETAATRGAKP